MCWAGRVLARPGPNLATVGGRVSAHPMRRFSQSPTPRAEPHDPAKPSQAAQPARLDPLTPPNPTAFRSSSGATGTSGPPSASAPAPPRMTGLTPPPTRHQPSATKVRTFEAQFTRMRTEPELTEAAGPAQPVHKIRQWLGGRPPAAPAPDRSPLVVPHPDLPLPPGHPLLYDPEGYNKALRKATGGFRSPHQPIGSSSRKIWMYIVFLTGLYILVSKDLSIATQREKKLYNIYLKSELDRLDRLEKDHLAGKRV